MWGVEVCLHSFLRWVVSITLWLPYSRERTPPLVNWEAGSKRSLVHAGIRVPDRPAHNVVAVPTALPCCEVCGCIVTLTRKANTSFSSTVPRVTNAGHSIRRGTKGPHWGHRLTNCTSAHTCHQIIWTHVRVWTTSTQFSARFEPLTNFVLCDTYFVAQMPGSSSTWPLNFMLFHFVFAACHLLGVKCYWCRPK